MYTAQEISNALLETDWHAGDKLEATRTPRGGFFFYRNGEHVGNIIQVREINGYHGAKHYLSGMNVIDRFQGTGIGHAMIQFVFDTLGLNKLALDSSAHQFYHKIGGQRYGHCFVVDRARLKPSKYKFVEIPYEPT